MGYIIRGGYVGPPPYTEERVWHNDDTLASKVNAWVRLLIWVFTLGTSGKLLYTIKRTPRDIIINPDPPIGIQSGGSYRRRWPPPPGPPLREIR